MRDFLDFLNEERARNKGAKIKILSIVAVLYKAYKVMKATAFLAALIYMEIPKSEKRDTRVELVFQAWKACTRPLCQSRTN